MAATTTTALENSRRAQAPQLQQGSLQVEKKEGAVGNTLLTPCVQISMNSVKPTPVLTPPHTQKSLKCVDGPDELAHKQSQSGRGLSHYAHNWAQD